MLSRLVHSRTLTFGVSCLLHLGLIAGVLLAERALSAHALRPLPVLPVELVTAPDPPPTGAASSRHRAAQAGPASAHQATQADRDTAAHDDRRGEHARP